MKFLFSLLLAFSCYGLLGHNIDVSGYVSDAVLGMPIEGVNLKVVETNQAIQTDGKGFFKTVLPSGRYNLVFQKDGYSIKKQEIEADEQPIKLDLALDILVVSLAEIIVQSDRPMSAASSKLLSTLDFQLRPRQSTQDMLRLVPGLFIAQHAGGGKAEQIFVRGFDCDHGTDIAVSVDGIAANMVSHGHGQGYMDLHFVIPETVQKMEVHKGPYFAEFGDFATAAAIKFKTLDKLPTNLLQFEVGSVPTNRALSSSRTLLMYQLPTKDTRFSSYFAGELIKADQYFEQSQDFIRQNLLSKTSFKPSDNSNVSLQFSGFGSSWDASGQIPERAVNQGLITRFGAIDPTEGGATSRRNIALNYSHNGDSKQLEFQAFQSQYRFKLFSNFTFALDDAVLGDGIEQVDKRVVTGLNVKYNLQNYLGTMVNNLTFGGALRADQIENGLYTQQTRTRTGAKSQTAINQQSTSLFVKNELQLTHHLRAEIGLRADYFIFDVDDQLATNSVTTHPVDISGVNHQTLISPKFNLSYRLDKTKLFFNSGRGFHSNDARSVVRTPSVNRLPSAWGAEVGALWSDDRTVLSAALWWLDLENELVYIGDAGQTEDKGASRRVGIDFSARTRLTQTLFFDADINISKSRFLNQAFGQELPSDALIPLAPTFTATSSLIVKTNKGLDGALRMRHLAARAGNEDNSVSTRAYTVIDFNATYQIKKYRFGFQVENLLNTEWNEAQFATESRLKDELTPTEEIHFTPGTPLALKVVVGYVF
jgi:outer membrane receptor for Fe3+-dicitrate